MVKTVLRFENKVTQGKHAVLRHAVTCPLAQPDPKFRYSIVEDTPNEVADLTERGFTIKTCKCAKENK